MRRWCLRWASGGGSRFSRPRCPGIRQAVGSDERAPALPTTALPGPRRWPAAAAPRSCKDRSGRTAHASRRGTPPAPPASSGPHRRAARGGPAAPCRAWLGDRRAGSGCPDRAMCRVDSARAPAALHASSRWPRTTFGSQAMRPVHVRRCTAPPSPPRLRSRRAGQHRAGSTSPTCGAAPRRSSTHPAVPVTRSLRRSDRSTWAPAAQRSS